MAKAKEATENDVEEAIDSSERREREDRGESGGHASARAAAGAETGASGVRNVLTIAVRELRSYFDSLVAYVVLGGSMLAVGIWFFLVNIGGSFWQTDHATMARIFLALPWALCVVIPLVTMRALAEEKRTGTLELLITMPVRDHEVILGKYIGAMAMVTMLFVALAVYPIAMFVWPWQLGPLDWGPVVAGFVGLFLYSAAGVAFGLMMSSLTDSQIISFFVTALVLVFFQFIGGIFEQLHGGIGDAVAFISFEARYSGFARGLIDTKAIVYFVSIAIICLLVSFRALESRKWS